MYFGCVGRNSALLLGTAPNRDGVIPEQDEIQLTRFGSRIEQLFDQNVLQGQIITATSGRIGEGWSVYNLLDVSHTNYWIAEDNVRKASVEITTSACSPINIIELKEPIQFGQRIDWHQIEFEREGRWHMLIEGSTIGYKRLHQVPQLYTTKLRITVHSNSTSPALEFIGAYYSPLAEIRAKTRRLYSYE